LLTTQVNWDFFEFFVDNLSHLLIRDENYSTKCMKKCAKPLFYKGFITETKTI